MSCVVLDQNLILPVSTIQIEDLTWPPKLLQIYFLTTNRLSKGFVRKESVTCFKKR